ncbi:MAG: FAD binding domain-containing protein [Streptosporangiaceae bacterium]
MDIDTITEFRPAPGTAWQPGDAWLGGGTWLFSQPQPELRRLLDLNGFGWAPLTESGGGLEIAATCTLGELARWRQAGPDARAGAAGISVPGAGAAHSWAAVPLLRQCCDALLASFKVQNMATVGGNICLALPAGAMTSLAAALDGVATLWSPGGGAREVPVTGFVTGPGTTVLGAGELLRSVTLPDASLRGRTAFRQASLSRMGRSAALVIGRTHGPGLVITVTAATPRPVQLRFAGRPSPEQATAALDRAGRDGAAPNWHDDVHGAPAWRAAMTRRFVAEVAAELREESTAAELGPPE